MRHYGITRIMVDGGREVCVRLFGDVDGDARDELRRELHDAVVDNTAPLFVIDLDETRFLDSEAIGALLEGCLHARESGKQAEIINARGVVRTVLTVTGVLDLFGSTAAGPNVVPLPAERGRPGWPHRRAT